MRNTFGNILTLTLFGESHGRSVGAVIDGLTPGIPVPEEKIAEALARRSPDEALSGARKEKDFFSLESGVYRGCTTGTPLCIRIENAAFRREDYPDLSATPRPGHADYTQSEKYDGFADLSGGGHSSGRLTAALVAAGAILLPALESIGIKTVSHIAQIGGITDAPMQADGNTPPSVCPDFPVIDSAAGEAMKSAILSAKKAGDTLGGCAETVIYGIPAGVGEPWFDTVEGELSHILFSIPAIKGVAFGGGFALCAMRGSEANDLFVADGKTVRTATNRAGGILGGITNGMPVLFRCAVKPTPSLALPQMTLDRRTGKPGSLQIRGRHDTCLLPRILPVIDAASAFAVADLLMLRYGSRVLREGFR